MTVAIAETIAPTTPTSVRVCVACHHIGHAEEFSYCPNCDNHICPQHDCPCPVQGATA
jgi:hypothetical protein